MSEVDNNISAIEVPLEKLQVVSKFFDNVNGNSYNYTLPVPSSAVYSANDSKESSPTLIDQLNFFDHQNESICLSLIDKLIEQSEVAAKRKADEAISKLKELIETTKEDLRAKRTLNLDLEKSINRLCKENVFFTNNLKEITCKIHELTTTIKNMTIDSETTAKKMESLARLLSKRQELHLSVEARSNCGTTSGITRLFTSAFINKIDDVVEDMEPIGHGGEGRVFRARLKDSQKPVVVKSYFLDCEHSSRIEYAMLTLGANIKSVKKPIALLQTETNFFLIMEDDHRSVPLDVIVDKDILTEPQIQHLFSQMTHTLYELNNKFIKHRDVKLDNFLLDTTTGQLTIIDFGWAMYSAIDKVTIDEVKRSGETLMGTFDYLPPETDSPSGTLVSYEKATVFALGCIILELFFGYQGRIRQFLIKEGFHGLLSRLVILKKKAPPKGAISLMEKCLKIDHRERISLEGILLHPWLPSDKRMSSNIGRAVKERGKSTEK